MDIRINEVKTFRGFYVLILFFLLFLRKTLVTFNAVAFPDKYAP